MMKNEINKIFVIQSGKLYVKIELSEIMCLRSNGNFTDIITENGNYRVSMPIKELEIKLPTQSFCRINRSMIIAVSTIVSFDEKLVYTAKMKAPLGPLYKNAFLKRVQVIAKDVWYKTEITELEIGKEQERIAC